MFSLIKKTFICLISILFCCLAGCKSDNGHRVCYDNSVVCGDDYIAYIAENGRLFMIDKEGADYVTDTSDLRKIENGMTFSNIIVMLYEDGTMNLFDTYSKSIVPFAEVESEEYQHFYPAFDLIMNAEDVEDFYYIYPEAILLLKNDKWYMGDNNVNKEICEELASLRVKKISVIPNYYNFLVLDKEGKLSFVGNDIVSDEYSQVRNWHNIIDIDACENTIIGLDRTGHVKTTYILGTYAGKIPDWGNARMVVAENDFTAAIDNIGKVLIYEGFKTNDELQKVLEWNDIIYISSSSNYIFGIDAEGKLWVSKPSFQKIIDKSDCPLVRKPTIE